MSNVVYCIESKIDHKKYIGKTNNFEARIAQHKKVVVGKHYNPYFQNYYNKYFKGKSFEEVFNVYLLHENVPDKDINAFERAAIIANNSRNPKRGFNLRFGGEGGKLTLDTRLRMKVAQRNRSSAKPFVYTVDGKFIGKFNSLVEVSEKLWLNQNAVNNAFNRGIRYKKYVFLREPAPENYKYVVKPTYKLVDIFVFDKEKTFIEKVNGMRNCAKKYGINPNTINTACNRCGLTFGTYYFSRDRYTFDKELGKMA